MLHMQYSRMVLYCYTQENVFLPLLLLHSVIRIRIIGFDIVPYYLWKHLNNNILHLYNAFHIRRTSQGFGQSGIWVGIRRSVGAGRVGIGDAVNRRASRRILKVTRQEAMQRDCGMEFQVWGHCRWWSQPVGGDCAGRRSLSGRAGKVYMELVGDRCREEEGHGGL